jgi:hypothetical protein
MGQNKRISIDFNRDGFEKDGKIAVDRSLNRISFRLENRSGDSHRSEMEIITNYDKARIIMDGRELRTLSTGDWKVVVTIPVSKPVHEMEILFN